MANKKLKPNHNGAKNTDRSFTRAEVKQASKKIRRKIKPKLHPMFWVDNPDDLPADFGL